MTIEHPWQISNALCMDGESTTSNNRHCPDPLSHWFFVLGFCDDNTCTDKHSRFDYRLDQTRLACGSDSNCDPRYGLCSPYEKVCGGEGAACSPAGLCDGDNAYWGESAMLPAGTTRCVSFSVVDLAGFFHPRPQDFRGNTYLNNFNPATRPLDHMAKCIDGDCTALRVSFQTQLKRIFSFIVDLICRLATHSHLLFLHRCLVTWRTMLERQAMFQNRKPLQHSDLRQTSWIFDGILWWTRCDLQIG